jgi:hypothetical protein
LGLSFNLKSIWDAIPWSFLVDWVIKVGDFLDGLSRGVLDPVLDILDYSWSIKRERHIQIYAAFSHDLPAGASTIPWNSIVDYPTYRETAYRRQPKTLSRNALILSGLSSRELSLAAALVVTRKPELKKPTNKRWRKSRRHLKRVIK